MKVFFFGTDDICEIQILKLIEGRGHIAKSFIKCVVFEKARDGVVGCFKGRRSTRGKRTTKGKHPCG